MTVPSVEGLPCDRLLDSDGGEYMRRYYLTLTGARQSRYHHIVASDPDDDMHDHPWDFTSRLLVGTYIEHTPDGITVYEAPCIIHRKAEQLHKLELPDGPVWSYVIHGRIRRKWGFKVGSVWVPWDKYNGGSVAGCGKDNPKRPYKPRSNRGIPRWLTWLLSTGCCYRWMYPVRLILIGRRLLAGYSRLTTLKNILTGIFVSLNQSWPDYFSSGKYIIFARQIYYFRGG